MIDTPQIAQSTARQVAMIRLTVPTSQIRTVMGPGISRPQSTPNRHLESGTNRLSFPDAWRSRAATRVRITSG
jgi:hypothetical protein